MDQSKALFRIVLPGGKVARVPYEVLEKHIEPGLEAQHSPDAVAGDIGHGAHRASRRGDGEVDGGSGRGRDEPVPTSADLAAHDANDVTAHHLAVDARTGISDWHLDYEQGPCEFVDDAGRTRNGYLWHRHPFGTEYTEIFEHH